MIMQNIERSIVMAETLKYFEGDELATQVWVNKYSLKDSFGNIFERTPEGMHRRIAKELARIDLKYPNPKSEDFYFEYLDRFKYIVPQGSPMAGIGNNLQTVSLSNCFVIGNGADSYGGIMKIDQEQVQLMKRRGGVGHDLGHIRPKGSPVKNSALTSTGVVPFMERYSNSTREVAQDGRRGALMLSIPVSHPDVEDFIDAKMELGKVTGANISVKVTDDWMVVVDRTTNEDVIRYKYLVGLDKKINSKEHLELMSLEDKIIYEHKFIFPNGEVFSKKAIAKELFDKLVYNAWKSAEPGVLYWDKMLSESLAECYHEFGFANVSTNPCMVGDTKVFTNKGFVSFFTLTEWFENGVDVKILTVDADGVLSYGGLDFCGITGENHDIFKISFENGEYYLTNNKHQLYDKEHNLVKVIDLKPGDMVKGYSGMQMVKSVEPMDYKENVYDLTVNPNLNFFASHTTEENFTHDKIVINDEVSYNHYDLVNTDKGIKFAIELEVNDDILEG